ncbi:simple sugar transport system ATP-binding protein [Streptomyces achromogenes]|uniref:sugar ABC transporter ATP-binding protein n=1 Tax=Streptomyces achromogenes TaxID=67255 RepID=UPI002789CD7D|nr:sugar ABC transporter ATP-binding protein [Streptomyces achromogenes]MDQ0835955.1 simple sugar transport system ATP-binding protein [Streptomyces achromogenes]
MNQTPLTDPRAGAAGRRAVVEAHGLRKRYGPTVALDDVRIIVRAGESHALVGRNGAGKSTLVAVLSGLQRPDRGVVLFDGEPAPGLADREAWERQVACVYQQSTIIPDLTVAENLYVNRQPTVRGQVISWRRMRSAARELLDAWGVEVDESVPAGGLTVEDAKMVEIARSISRGTRFIILDEPTAQLDSRAIDRLFTHVRRLQRAGITFLYISHHLEEVYAVCQVVTVMRDARRITTAPVGEMGRTELVEAMTGRRGAGAAPGLGATRSQPADAAVAVRVHRLSGPHFTDVSFAVRSGETVGLTGLAGSGSHQVAEALAGLYRPDSGRVEVLGRPTRPGSVPSALAAGVGCVPRDRHYEGLVPELSVAENASMTIMDRLGRLGVISRRARDAFARRTITGLDITTDGLGQPVKDLSGGNQQKVVMGRALATDPEVLVLINPTAGVDVQSKRALLSVVDRARAAGRAALVVSDELADLRICDRVLVMFDGSLAAEYTVGWTDEELVASIEGVGTGHE